MSKPVIAPDRESIAQALQHLPVDMAGAENQVRQWQLWMVALADAAGKAGGETVKDAAYDLVAAPFQSKNMDRNLLKLQGALEDWQAKPNNSLPVNTADEALAQDPELVTDFVVESRDHLASVETNLLEIERNPGNKDAVHAVFRSFHTIKGLAAFLEFNRIRDVAHETETILDRVRNGEMAVTPDLTDVILLSLDYLKSSIASINPSGCGPFFFEDSADLIAQLRDVLEGKARATAAAETSPAVQNREESPKPAKAETKAANTNLVKIDTHKLDFLVDMVGELVVAQSLIRYDSDVDLQSQPKLAKNLAQLARITHEVQRTAMAMRMVPIGGLFQKMARLTRDLTRKFGKHAEFESSGDSVELDRSIVEELADPLMHMVRNAVDHGMDTPEERAASGKPDCGRIQLRALHRSGQIVIQICDDGRGLNRDKILAKAIAQGLVQPGAKLSDSEIYHLIFAPGFSTAEKLSEISGRGVGMDVVAKQIQKLRGVVDIQSKAGAGTTFSLRLPLTLAIIEGLVVEVGQQTCIFPLSNVKELFRPVPEQLFMIENRSEAVLVREQLLPLVRLSDCLHIPGTIFRPEDAVLVLAETDLGSYCLMVDRVLGKREVVIKNLGPMFQHNRAFAGCAILGDGKVGLILEPSALQQPGT